MGHAEFEYVSGQGRPTFPVLLQSYAEASASVRARDGVRRDVPYGPHPRQRFDFFPAAGRAVATLVYYHAGYWQSRDKEQFAFLAGPYNGSGLNVVLVNYPLCPEVTVEQIVKAVSASLAPIIETTGEKKLILAGHSAGAHLAVELSLASSVDADIRGVVGLSGVYDLQPLLETTLNKALQLDDQTARAASPVHRLRNNLPKAIFAVGGEETEAFLQQSRRMESLWQSVGNRSEHEVCRGEDHFSILQNFINPAHPLYRAVTALALRSAE